MKDRQKNKAKPKRHREINCIPVFGNTVFFNIYLLNEIGGRWPRIKDSLYEAGYSPAQVNEYRNNLLNDFFAFCKKHHLEGRV